MKRRCLSFEGCRGDGWMWDSTDSGSGAQAYCDCPAGDELKLSDAIQGPDAQPQEKK